MRRRAFTITELMMAILLMSIMAGVMSLSSGAARQTAKREAEKVAVKLGRLVETADRTRSSFWVDVKEHELLIRIGPDYRTPAMTSTFSVDTNFTLTPEPDKKCFGYLTDASTADGDSKIASKRNVSITTGPGTLDNAFNIYVKGNDTSPCFVRIYEND